MEPIALHTLITEWCKTRPLPPHIDICGPITHNVTLYAIWFNNLFIGWICESKVWLDKNLICLEAGDPQFFEKFEKILWEYENGQRIAMDASSFNTALREGGLQWDGFWAKLPPDTGRGWQGMSILIDPPIDRA